MLHRSLGLYFVLGAVLSSTSAFADVPIGSAGAGWQSWTASTVTTNYGSGTPYWNGNSSDGNDKNVGNCLLAASYCGLATAPGNIPYWGNSDGSADTSLYFQGTGSQNNAALEIEIAGNAGINEFGWYQVGVADPTLHVLFNGPASAGATAIFTPTADYGFWFSGNGTTYYTQSGLNATGSDPNLQHFALFNGGSGAYWLGMEDLNFGKSDSQGSDKDYQDMIVKVQTVSTPEPTAITLLVTMLAPLFVIGFAARRRMV